MVAELSVESSRNRPPIDLNKSPARSSSPPGRPRSRSPPNGFPSERPCYPDDASSSGPLPSASGMVPSTTLPCSNILEYGLENPKLFRLTSIRNVSRVFELRRYTFPADTPLKLTKRNIIIVPIPTQEQVVMSTFDGDVYAVLESNDNLSGFQMFYEYKKHDRYKRAKMNMESGKPTFLTSEEIYEIPVGPNHPIKRFYIINRVNRV